MSSSSRSRLTWPPRSGPTAAVTVIRLIGLNVILDGLSAIPNAMLMRSFQQGRRAIVDVGAFFPGAAVSIGLAAAGWGPMALVWGSLAGNVTAVTLVYLLAPCRPLPGWRGSDAGALVKCGLPFAATSAVYLATLNVDYVVVGRVLGTTALGLYLLAFNLSTWPANLVSLSIRRVSIPAFSRLADDPPELSRVFARSLHLVMIPGGIDGPLDVDARGSASCSSSTATSGCMPSPRCGGWRSSGA